MNLNFFPHSSFIKQVYKDNNKKKNFYFLEIKMQIFDTHADAKII